jgi:hypothetical protein
MSERDKIPCISDFRQKFLPYLVDPEKVKNFSRGIYVDKENIRKHYFFFTGKLRKKAHFLVFYWKKILPSKESG